MRGYCDFYEVDARPTRRCSPLRALIADPEREGVQLIARASRRPRGRVRHVYWTWQTLTRARWR